LTVAAPSRAGWPRLSVTRLTVVWVSLALFVWVLLRTAWMCDDAFITLRTIDNLVNGFGLRWNVAERVQTFTHPLWLLLLTPIYAITREPFLTTLAVQAVLSLATMFLLWRYVALSASQAAVTAAIILSSRAVTDFSTSGLENPLTHLLLVAIFIAWRSERVQGALRVLLVSALAGLALLCRADLVLLLAPVAVATILAGPSGSIVAALVGLLPVAAWEVFSWIYYGMLLPNTALAKLSTGVSTTALIEQGWHYWHATLLIDPVTVAAIVAGAAMLLVAGRREGRLMGAGIVLFALYLFRVGGDFMSGRFLTPLLIWILVGAAGLPVFAGRRWRLAFGGLAPVILLLGLLPGTPPLVSGTRFGQEPGGKESEYVAYFGVADERRFYYPTTGLLRRLGYGGRAQTNVWVEAGRALRARAQSGRVVIEANNVGMVGYYAGPHVHIIDRNALCDPLLSRLPAKPGWRIGHFTRAIPDGYVDGWRAGTNGLTDPALHAYYDKIRTLTQGDIWSSHRLALVWRFSLGQVRP
jgi:arabinofuranosyltransferase